MSQTSQPLLEVTDLHTSFVTERGLLRAVDGVSLRLDRGRTLGIVGESGSGKSVLVRSIMNLLPASTARRTGRIVFDGEDVTARTPREMRAVWGVRMAMVFQNPMTSLNPVMRVGRQITESLRYHRGLGRAEAVHEALALLEAVGIPEPAQRLRQYPGELSGGMRQRVCIAIALACGPSLLFADEPTTALDVTVQAQILDLMAAQQRDRQMAMVIITHDLGVVASRTDEIAVMYAGRIVEAAPTPVLFASMRMPYTEALFRSIPRLEEPSHVRLPTIGGRPPDLASPPAGCAFSPRCPYAQERCHAESPPLRAGDDPRHRYACWYPLGSDAAVTVAAGGAGGR